MSEDNKGYGMTLASDDVRQVEAFQVMLNKAPSKSETKSQTLGGKQVNYVPIGVIEKTLDELYMGLWQITDLRHTITLNSIAVTLTLQVFHPVGRVWLSRGGVGAVKVQLNQGATAMDVTQMKPDAIQKGLPAAKAMALKNAAQTLGVAFGRDLNRDVDSEFIYLADQFAELQNVAFEALQLLDASTMTDEQKADVKKAIDGGSLRKVEQIVEWLKKGGSK